MIPEKVLINLKILSKIQKNGKITRSYDGVISLESQKYLQFVKRTLYGDSRICTLHEINSIITESVSALNSLFDSKTLINNSIGTQEWHSTCQDIRLLINELHAAKIGIDNLKFTYIKDINVNAKLDVYLHRISNVLRDSMSRYYTYSHDIIHLGESYNTTTITKPIDIQYSSNEIPIDTGKYSVSSNETCSQDETV